MGCNCGGQKTEKIRYAITGDPDNLKYLTEYEAKQQRTARGLSGEVVPVKG